MTSSNTQKDRSPLRTFRSDVRAASAITFGLLVVPFLGVLGLAVDYSLFLADKSKLDGAADAASLAAIKTAQTVIQASGTSARQQAITSGNTQALAAFQANAGHILFGTVPTPTITWPTSTNAQTITAKVQYSVPVNNLFGRMFGVATTAVTGASTASLTMPTYINYYVIVDISQSMGVGATQTDMTNLYNRVITYSNYDSTADAKTKTGCVFGCHVAQSTQTVSNEVLAHSTTYGTAITLRIDSAKAAIQDMLTSAINAQTSQDLVQIGVYTMQQNPQSTGTYFADVQNPPSYDFTTTQTEVAAIDLGPNNSGGTGDTGFTNSLNAFTTNRLSTQGDGTSRANALNYVFIITDGLSDVPGSSCTSGHCTGAFDDTLCTQLKAKATVGVVYTTYNPIYLNQNYPSLGYNSNYTALVAPYVGSIPSNLQACSSDSTSYYYEAQDGPGITTGIEKLFASSSASARLTQ